MADQSVTERGLAEWAAEYSLAGLQLAAHADWKSFDPFDLLASPRLARIGGRSTMRRRVAVQAGRRIGTRARRRLGMEPRVEAKAVADLLSAARRLHGLPVSSGTVPTLCTELLRLAVQTPSGVGWGLAFPYASRFVDAQANTPNAYTTACVAHALLDAHEITNDSAILHTAVRAIAFLRRDLGQIAVGGWKWNRYWPGLDSPITNVQSLLAWLFARVAVLTNDESLFAAAVDLADLVAAVQRPDGSWLYSEDEPGAFVDGFHSGFVLEGLAGFIALAPAARSEAPTRAFTAGMRFFRRHLVTAAGLPLAKADGRITHDAQSAAQALQTLLLDRADVYAGDQALRNAFVHLTTVVPLAEPVRTHQLSLRWHVGPAVLAAARLFSSVVRRPASA